MPFCTECGKGVEPGDNFCPWCGTAVSKSTESMKLVSPVDSVNEEREVNSNKDQIAPVSSTTRIAPIYGPGYRRGIHCWNCGSKPGSGKKCQTCLAET